MEPDIDRQALIDAAMTARQRAYAPYSTYRVGAAVQAGSGHIYAGCNVENAVYPLTTCAERVAIVKAVSEGEYEIVALAVATDAGATPCGSCRQTLREFAVDVPVILVDSAGCFREISLADLLPDSFSAADLE